MSRQQRPSPPSSTVDLSAIADPERDTRQGLFVTAIFFIGFLGWAAFSRLDAAAYATGSLVVAGQHQSVQHRDGGVVGRIYVREGQRVQRGDLLVRLAAADVRAQERHWPRNPSGCWRSVRGWKPRRWACPASSLPRSSHRSHRATEPRPHWP